MFRLAAQINTNAAKPHQQTRLVCLTTKTIDWLNFFWLNTAVRDGSFLWHFLPNKNTLETGCSAIFFPQRLYTQQEHMTLSLAAGSVGIQGRIVWAKLA